LLPNLSLTGPKMGEVGDLERSFRVKTNDQLMRIYLRSMFRAVLALHDLTDSGIDQKKDEKKEKVTKEVKQEEDKKANGAEEKKDSK
jgi:26S proteasome regulatory subunit N8